MLETLEATKHETLKLINDVVYFENLFLIRSTDKLTAISSDSHKTVWEIELKGETLINLYKIYTVNNVIITFSYFREEDLYGIHGIDSSGKLLWSSSVAHQPNGVHAVCVKNDKLIYNGYSSSSTDTLILEVDPVNGSVSPILSLETSASNLCNINENIILSGSSGIYIMEEKSNSLKQISDDFIVNILSSSDREMKYISQSGEKGIYNVVVLDENLTTTIMGNVNLDSSNKGNMTPTLNGGNMISFKGRNKGVAYTDLTNGNVIWHIGDGEIRGISVQILDNKNFALLHDDLDLNTNLFIYDINTGDLIKKTNYKGMTDKLYCFKNTLIVGSSRGMHIYDLSKN